MQPMDSTNIATAGPRDKSNHRAPNDDQDYKNNGLPSPWHGLKSANYIPASLTDTYHPTNEINQSEGLQVTLTMYISSTAALDYERAGPPPQDTGAKPWAASSHDRCTGASPRSGNTTCKHIYPVCGP